MYAWQPHAMKHNRCLVDLNGSQWGTALNQALANTLKKTRHIIVELKYVTFSWACAQSGSILNAL